MIVHYAQGGLGNQLFNYAAARSLADRLSTDLLIDAASYSDQWEESSDRPLLLHHFPVRAQFRNLGSSNAGRSLHSRVARKVRESWLSRMHVRPSGEIGFFDEFKRLGRNTILKGHFIDLRFFEGREEQLREDLALAREALPADAYAEQLCGQVETASCPVALHVRRGDLLESGNRWLVLDEVERYYVAAMAHVAGNVRTPPQFFVFSDDPHWCRQALSYLPHDVTVADHIASPSASALWDFYLMSRCHHHIIANSAFSWWPAWLNPRPDKLVVAPYKFDNMQRIDVNTLYPSEWTRLRW